MSDNIEKLQLSDNFDVWRDKINNVVGKMNLVSAFPEIDSSITGTGYIITNTRDKKPVWKHIQTLLDEQKVIVGGGNDSSDDTISGDAVVDSIVSRGDGTIQGHLYVSQKPNSLIGGNITADGTIQGTVIKGNSIESITTIKAGTSFLGQNIELSAPEPYIDFHCANSTKDYTSRIIESETGVLSINGNKFSTTGSVINTDLRVRSTKNDSVIGQDDSVMFFKTTAAGAASSTLTQYPLSITNSTGIVNLGYGLRSDVRIVPNPILDKTKRSLVIRNQNGIASLQTSQSLTGTTDSIIPISITLSDGNITIGSNLLTAIGDVDVKKTITANKVYGAVWNDYAEFFEKGEETEVGDIIGLIPSSDKELYGKARNKKTIVGVHSNTYGHIIGGRRSIEHSELTHIPVGMIGRVKTKIIGTIKSGDEIVLSNIPGVGRKYIPETDKEREIIGFAVESNDSEEIKLVKIKI